LGLLLGLFKKQRFPLLGKRHKNLVNLFSLTFVKTEFLSVNHVFDADKLFNQEYKFVFLI
jgi:hypothetical protein